MGDSLAWIGIQISVLKDRVRAEVPQDKVAELRQLAREVLEENVVPDKHLRSIIGKFQNVASLLYALRTFLSALWGGAVCTIAGGAESMHMDEAAQALDALAVGFS